MKNKISEHKKRKIINLTKNNFSRVSISKMTGVSTSTIDRILRKEGISSNGKAQSKHPSHDDKIKELHGKNIACKLAAKQLNISYNHYITRRKQLGLPYIPIKQVRKFTQRQKDILIGTMMGDGNISMSGKGVRIETYKFNMGHSKKQFKYFEWKYKELELQGSILGRLDNKGYWGLFGGSKPYQNLKYYYWLFYKKGKKKITKYMLSKLTPLSIAVWFMDDGTTSDTYYICTQSFGKEGCEKIRKWFYNTYAIETTLNFPKHKNQPIIRIKSSSRDEFTKLIKPYIIESMQYKLFQ